MEPDVSTLRTKRKRRVSLLGVCFGVTLFAFGVAALALVALHEPEFFLLVDSYDNPHRIEHDADAILLLGGDDALYRHVAAARLYELGVAPKVIVTGALPVVRERLVEMGVRDEDLLIESSATDTRQNALNTRSYLESLGARRVILVTSWFHTRRALATFRHYDPDLEFVVFAARRCAPPWMLSHELMALGWYAVRYNISPFV